MKRQEYKNIAIIRLSALGDIIHALPAFTLLREAFPHSKISWLVEPVGAKLLKNFTGIDEIITVDLKKKTFFNKIKEAGKIRSRYGKTFDLVLDLQGLLKSAFLARLLKGKVSVGFHKRNLREPLARIFYTRTAGLFDETDRADCSNHVAFKNIHLVNFGGHISGNIVSRTTDPADAVNVGLADLTPWENGVKQFLSGHGLEINNFMVLNIGGGWETKLLYPDQYVEIVNGVKKKYRVVVLWGNEKEKKVAEEISQKTGAVMTEFLNFSELILLIGYSRLIVTGDTLALHLADLLKTPSVGIFGPTSPSRNGSLLAESIAVFEKLPCGFCYKKKCGTIDCIKKINMGKIIQAIGILYEKHN